MGTDYAEKEREFVDSLEADTGRALDAWMRAIAEAGLTQRNDIIDWLRLKGFTFSNASWLERIHHNGGRLVYADDERHAPPIRHEIPRAPPQRAPPSAAAPRAIPVLDRKPVAVPANDIEPAANLNISADPAPAVFDAAVADLLASAKGLRPLALLMLQEIKSAVPQTTIEAEGALIMLHAPKPFLALLASSKALRLYGDFGPAEDGRVARAESAMKVASKAPPPFRSVLALDDARLVDPVFRALVKAAHARSNT